MTYQQIVNLGLQLPEVQESTSYGTPSLKRKNKFMLRLKEEGDSIAVKLDWENHDRLLVEHPGVIYKTAHYLGYPALLVKLESVSPTLAQQIVKLSWDDAPHPAKTIPKS